MIKILLVEDSVPLVRVLKSYLENQGYIVIAAENGEKAINLITQMELDPPDIYLIDIMLPIKTGYDVLKFVKSNPITVSAKVIMVSSRNTKNDVIKALELGATDYLLKPFSFGDLMGKIEKVLVK